MVVSRTDPARWLILNIRNICLSLQMKLNFTMLNPNIFNLENSSDSDQLASQSKQRISGVWVAQVRWAPETGVLAHEYNNIYNIVSVSTKYKYSDGKVAE